MTSRRLIGALERLLRHVAPEAVGLTGSLAVDWHLRSLGERRSPPPGDVDLVAASLNVIPPAIGADFLISHFHTPHAGYDKFLIQLVDPVWGIRIDVFPDLAARLESAQWQERDGIRIRVLTLEHLLDQKRAILGNASPAEPVDAKHDVDARRLGELCGVTIPAAPAGQLTTQSFSTDLAGTCARCDASRTPAFPLAPKSRVFAILGYV